MSVYPQVNATIPNCVPNGTLFVCVNDSYSKELKNPRTKELVSLEDCARGFWNKGNLKAAKYENCKWLAAYSKCKILGIWKIDKWFPMTENALVALNRSDDVDKSRLYCTLRPIDNETRNFQNQVVGQGVRIGSCPNSIRGYFKD